MGGCGRSNIVIRRKIDITQHHLCFHKCRIKWLSQLGPLLGTFKLLKTGVILIVKSNFGRPHMSTCTKQKIEKIQLGWTMNRN